MTSIDPGAAIGRVQLRVSDLERSLTFYTTVLGLDVLSRDAGRATVGVDGRALVVLSGSASGGPRPRRTTGIYHFAILVPSRADLGHALARVLAARWPLQGASDHGVSEALYLGDPDGIGIEIYRDRPRAAWPVRDGALAMVTEPLDLQALLDEAPSGGQPAARLPADTRLGHVHLQVRDINEAERFYHGALGFDVMQRMAASALFVSAGGYHHHLGLNTWGVAGAPPQPEATPGLDYFTVVVPAGGALDGTRAALASAGVSLVQRDGGWLARDPSDNRVLVVEG
ncbi:MAG: VOC family protein [Gemmatimonadaceae bacterium]